MFISLAKHLALLAEQQRRYDLLLEHYHDLRAQGASAPTPQSIAPLEKKKADRVSEVIADVAGTNAALRRQLGVYARRARAEQVDDDEIVKTLLHWPDDDDHGAPE